MPHFRTLTEISYELAQRIPPLHRREPIFFLAQNEPEARQLFALCRYWEPTFSEHVIISSYYQQHQHTSQKEYERMIVHIQIGDTKHSISQLARRLVELGFEKQPRAVAERTFAVRGDVLDIVDRQAWRIEFNDNTIEHITRLQPSSQRAAGMVNDIMIWPRQYAAHIPTWHEADLEYEFVTPKFYHKRFQLLKKDVQSYLKVEVATNQPDAVRAILPQAKLRELVRGLEGFIVPNEHFLFLTDLHIFGRENVAEEFTSELNVGDLEPGEYIVHVDHGVGLFHGLTEIDGEQYLELHYAKNDKLYIPISQLKRVDRYVGSDTPKLTRLSGAHWEQVVHTIQEDIRVTARELLELYAKREIAHAVAFNIQPAELETRVAHDVDFELTADQLQAISDVHNDLATTTPMNRLLCGDVGFGKTEVALRAAAHVVEQGGQVALLAPTTVLAQQHYDTFRERLEPYGVRVGLLSRLAKAAEQTDTLRSVRSRQIDIVIGTHRLLSNDVQIPKLQLAIIDEEQRFGVRSKERFKALRSCAHVLTMTATPIPRTLNLALSGVQDMSILDTAPKHRQAVATVIAELNPALELDALAIELERNGQVYVVHNDLRTITQRAHWMQEHFPDRRVEVAHGQMTPGRLVRIMRDFHAGSIDVLVASTIIENGLDIANANTLVVEQAEQFGLAQLYQLRGRIGRSSTKAYAYFLYRGQHLTEQSKRRLKALRSVKELGGGFELAMKDLEIRGVGDLLGKKQHGHVQQIGLNLYTHLLQQAIQELQD